MRKLNKEDISQDLFDLYDDYVHKRVDRRVFLEKLSIYAMGGISKSSLPGFMMPNFKDSITVKADDPRLNSRIIMYDRVDIPAITKKPLLCHGSVQ